MAPNRTLTKFTILACFLFLNSALRGVQPASKSDTSFATEVLDALSNYDKERIASHTHDRNSDFADLRPYDGWFVYGVDPKRMVLLGHASQRKRYLHVECKISDRISPGRDWNNYLLELHEIDGRVFLSKVRIPGQSVEFTDAKTPPKEIAEAICRRQETNEDATTTVTILCQEQLADTDELKAYRCSLMVERYVHELRIPTYVDSVIYLVRGEKGYSGFVVH